MWLSVDLESSSSGFGADWRTPHEHWMIGMRQEVSHRHFHTCVEKITEKLNGTGAQRRRHSLE
jgi:hypothetical protein